MQTLSDIERKVLRIITNMAKIKGRMPTVQELSIKTGRSEKGIIKVLEELHNERLIRWDPNSGIIQLVNPYTLHRS